MTPDEASQEIARGCLCRKARVLSRRVTRIYDDALREIGITSTQLTLLVAVQEAGGSASQADLGDWLAMTPSTVSRTVGRMVEAGWLKKSALARGVARRPLLVSASGRRVLKRALPRWRAAQAKALEELGQDLLGQL